MISKELLNVMLGIEIGKLNIIGKNIYYDEQKRRKGSTDYSKWVYGHTILNSYELANKCKEWAFEQGYHIFAYRVKGYMFEVLVVDNGTYYQNSNLQERVVKCKNGTNMHCYEIPTETEAIFKACDYILKELNNKDN